MEEQKSYIKEQMGPAYYERVLKIIQIQVQNEADSA